MHELRGAITPRNQPSNVMTEVSMDVPRHPTVLWKHRRLSAICVALAFFRLLMRSRRQLPTAETPNIVMLMTDDTGWNDFSAYRAVARLLATRPRTLIGSSTKARRCSILHRGLKSPDLFGGTKQQQEGCPHASCR